MAEENRPDIFDVAAGAQKLALRTAIQALIEHASATDPDLRNRIVASVEAYITKLDPQSDLERDFAERATAHVAALVRPPASYPADV